MDIAERVENGTTAFVLKERIDTKGAADIRIRAAAQFFCQPALIG